MKFLKNLIKLALNFYVKAPLYERQEVTKTGGSRLLW